MRILVAGGAGFIGSHLCDTLLDQGAEVICIDNLITGQAENIAHLHAHPRFQFVQADICSSLPVTGPLDRIYHLASPASPPGYLRRPLETALVNSLGTYHLLELARATGARFLLASTSEAYGDPLVHPQTEDYWGNVNPIGVRSCYDEGKRFAEALTMVYVREYGVDARIVRIFNCYGPRSDPNDGRLIPNFVTQALTGQPLTVYGEGTQTRSLCYVSDLVDGLVRAIETPGTTGRVYNLGNPDERSVLEFAQLIKRITGSPSEIVFQPLTRDDDPRRRCPDISRARAELGWEPRVSLDEGLTRTIAWFRERLGLGAQSQGSDSTGHGQ
ncbi:MAG TPA: UDP-glucuronic acid decarboxylase family protein [Chloroflexota bacterium]|nr:UDP-glucuronic acid decarboxylase family protein [Chloroflexota bacterium]